MADYASLTAQRRFKIPMPDTNLQQKIASILGVLDEKIDLNLRMNETFDATARVIFKDWFVDCGPTRAKMEGRASYLAPELWALFPNRIDEEGKPEGWQLKPASAPRRPAPRPCAHSATARSEACAPAPRSWSCGCAVSDFSLISAFIARMLILVFLHE
jgi:hypothetical protein